VIHSGAGATEEKMPEPVDDDVAARMKREQRAMWIFAAAVTLLILVAMGANMMFHKDAAATLPADSSSQSKGSEK